MKPLSEEELARVQSMLLYDAATTAQRVLSENGRSARHPAANAALVACSGLSGVSTHPSVAPRVGNEVFVPIETRNETNARGSMFRERHRRTAAVRDTVPLVLRSVMRTTELPVLVTLTRVSKRPVDEYNLSSTLKAVIDAVSLDFLGVDDSDPRVKFRYGQSASDKRTGEGVLVRMEWGFGPTWRRV